MNLLLEYEVHTGTHSHTGKSLLTRENSPAALGDDSSANTEVPPEDCPAMVTKVGSPSTTIRTILSMNATMNICIHV